AALVSALSLHVALPISGGGDSALDWSIFLTDVAKSVTLVHRRNEFRGALDSVEKVQELKNLGKIELITPAEVIGLVGNSNLEEVDRKSTRLNSSHVKIS